MLLVVINVVCKEECAGLDGALSFTYYGERNPYPGSTSTVLMGAGEIPNIRTFEYKAGPR